MRGIMDITCPSCAAVYDIEDASVTVSGRKVRCAACTTVWRVYPPDLEPDLHHEQAKAALSPPAQTEGVPQVHAQSETETSNTSPAEIQTDRKDVHQEGESEESSQAVPRRVKWAKDKKPEKQPSLAKQALVSWHAAAIAAAVCVVGFGLHQRERVVQFLPQAAKIYAAVGLQVNLRGIEIKGVSSRIIDDNGVSVLVVDGDLLNVTGRKLDVPRLRFAVRGQEGQEVYVWSAQADRSSLQPGEVLNFRRRLAAPPIEGKDVSVRFVTRTDITSGIK
jgi:predicted Zn finger-like uncharacterized protein